MKKEVYKEAIELLKSAHCIALREGNDTNWDTFINSIEKILLEHQYDLYGKTDLERATTTARTYKVLSL